MLFHYALKAPATKEKCIQRLSKFLDYLGYPGTKKEKDRSFADRARADPVFAFNSVLRFFQSKREQIDRKEIAIGTVRNYVKSIKLFCDMAELQIRLNGLQLFYRIKAVSPTTKIMFSSALDIVEELTSILPDIKYEDIIKKPLKRVYFISKINSVFDTSTGHLIA
jgi:hypothetical protein